jgi:hypothetical protein
MATETIPELPTPPQQTPAEFSQEFKENWMNVRLAHEGLMIEDIQKRNLKVHELADAVRHGTVGKPAPASSPAGAEDVGVKIGNKEFHYHIQTTQAAQANTSTSAPEASPQVAGTTNKLGKLAAAAALIGAGGIGVAGVNMAIDYLNKPAPVVTQPAVDTDTDTNSKLRFED